MVMEFETSSLLCFKSVEDKCFAGIGGIIIIIIIIIATSCSRVDLVIVQVGPLWKPSTTVCM